MFIKMMTSGPLEANCFLLANDEGCDCVIIDPGMEAAVQIETQLGQHRLTPAAILATHGHYDHIADVALLADRYGIPAWIRSEDRHLLTQPLAGVDAAFGSWLATLLPKDISEPAQLGLLDDYRELSIAGLDFAIIYAPGHTRGSVLFRLNNDGDDLIFTGDVLFAGSIGRTDMPGGNLATMCRTLLGTVLSLPDLARLLPGHGSNTTMANERSTNPYLSQRWLSENSV